jgi:ferredoxin
MAELAQRLEINAPGKYYVDHTCIDCDLCRQIAPDTFQRADDRDSSYVARQPATRAEIAAAEDAMLECPTNTIGNDGPEN